MVQLGDGPPSFTKVLFVHQGCGGLQSWMNDVHRRSNMLEFDAPSKKFMHFHRNLVCTPNKVC
jgi:hypothetical protein